jgi:hypothetical protein
MWERRGRTAVGEKGRQRQRVSRSPVRGGWAARSPARGGWASLVAEPPGALVVGRMAARSPAAEGRQVAVTWGWASSVAELPSAPVMGIR